MSKHKPPRRWYGRLLDLLFAWNTAYDEKSPTDGMSNVFWVLGMIITQGAALIVAVHGSVKTPVVAKNGFKIQQVATEIVDATEPTNVIAKYAYRAGLFTLPGLYICVSVVMLLSLLCIIRSQKLVEAGWRRTYTYGTISGAWIVAACSVILMSLITTAAVADTLPGEKVDIQSTGATGYLFKLDSTKGIEVQVKLKVVDFPGGTNQMRFWAYLSPALREKFYISGGMVYKGNYFADPARDTPADAVFNEDDKKHQRLARLKLQDMEKGQVYTFVFKVHALEKTITDADIQDALNKLHTDPRSFSLTIADPD